MKKKIKHINLLMLFILFVAQLAGAELWIVVLFYTVLCYISMEPEFHTFTPKRICGGFSMQCCKHRLSSSTGVGPAAV